MPSHLLPLLGLLAFNPAISSAGEIIADKIQRDPYGMIQAEGNVHFTSKGIDIRAEKIIFDVDSQQSEIEDAAIITKERQRLNGKHIQRIDLETFEGKDVTYTLCPEDDLAWALVASEARLDNDAGEFTAKHVRFEWAGIPVLYTPYWRHALTRRSGFLIPSVSNSTRRGFQVDTPFYWAGSPNWDMTLISRTMSLRGIMADIDWRHRSRVGEEQLQVQAIRDNETGTKRGRLRTDMGWRLSSSIDAALDIDAVSDGLYIADFPLYAGDNETAAYLTSDANIAWREGSDSAVLSTRYQQRLGGASNASTLQILPRVQTRNYFSALDGQSIKLDHQTTSFQREVGVSGLRTGLKPSWSLPWQMLGGAVTADWSVQGQFVGYDSQSFASTTSSYAALATSLEVSAAFEKVFSKQRWRHEIKPIVRFDASSTQDQSALPRYDSGLVPLNMSNLLQGNRYSGWDRFERMRRVSMLLSSTLQAKEKGVVRNVLNAQLGLAYDGLLETVDNIIAPASSRAESNLLAELAWMPAVAWRLNIGGQYNQPNVRWVETHGGINWAKQGEYFNISWRRTDASYSQEAESVSFSGKVKFNQRWSADTYNQYDLLRERVIQTRLNVAYRHTCWDFSLGGYKTFQVGTNSLTDIGWRFLLTFDGLGSLGET